MHDCLRTVVPFWVLVYKRVRSLWFNIQILQMTSNFITDITSFDCLQRRCELTDFLCRLELRLRLSTMYSEYISFWGLAGSSRCCSLDSASTCWNPSSSVGLVGRSVRMSHTRRDNTCAFVCGMWCCNKDNVGNETVGKNELEFSIFVSI